MTEPIVDRVLRSARYRDVDRALLDRLASEELPKSRNADESQVFEPIRWTELDTGLTDTELVE